MKIKIPLYIISAVLGIIGFSLVMVMIYLDLINSGISSRFFWVLSVACIILCILSFSLARILVIWGEEDDDEEEQE